MEQEQGQTQSQPVQDQPKLETANANRTFMGVLSYLGILVFIPFFTSKEDSFVKYHIKQGLVVFSIEVIIWIIGMMFYGFWMIANVLNLAVIVLSIVGIINVIGNKEKELPLVGQYSKYFTF